MTKKQGGFGVYQLWSGNERLGSYGSISRLQKAWTKAQGQGVLSARVYTGNSFAIINDQMPVPVLREYRTAAERDGAIEKEADYFTVVRFLGVGQYERHERPSRKEAIDLATALSKQVKGNYLIYAINSHGNQAYVTTIKYNKG